MHTGRGSACTCQLEEFASWIKGLHNLKLIVNLLSSERSFLLQLPGEQNGRAKYLSWFDDINRLRRVSAHPYNRGYDDLQVERLNMIHAKLKERNVF